MTDPKIIRFIDQMCVKNGDIEVSNVGKDGTYTLTVPVLNGAEEFNEAQIATLDMEYTFDGDEVILHNFPTTLLSNEDYIAIVQSIEETMLPIWEFMALGDKYGLMVSERAGKYHLCAKNTDKRWTPWITYDPQKDSVVCHGNTDYLNIWLCDTRKDFTPEKCLQFVGELNELFAPGSQNKLCLKDLIDPEDWQEIAQVKDAYVDERYTGNNQPSQENQKLDFIFDEEIMISDDRSKLEGYVWAADSLVARLEAQEPSLGTYQYRENINFYPVYDISKGTISLEGHYHLMDTDKASDTGKAFELPLSQDESSRLMDAFETYCKKTEGMSCLDFLNSMREAEGLTPLPGKPFSDRLQSAVTRAALQTAQPQKEEEITR